MFEVGVDNIDEWLCPFIEDLSFSSNSVVFEVELEFE